MGKGLSPRGSQELSRSPFEREGIPATPFFNAGWCRGRSGVAETAPFEFPLRYCSTVADSGKHHAQCNRLPRPCEPTSLASGNGFAAARSDRHFSTLRGNAGWRREQYSAGETAPPFHGRLAQRRVCGSDSKKNPRHGFAPIFTIAPPTAAASFPCRSEVPRAARRASAQSRPHFRSF